MSKSHYANKYILTNLDADEHSGRTIFGHKLKVRSRHLQSRRWKSLKKHEREEDLVFDRSLDYRR